MSDITSPPPTETHPAYAGIQVPLGRDDGFADFRLPIVRSVQTSFNEPPDPMGPGAEIRVLTVKRCCGPAPYAGRPFAYHWKVAVDDLGRAIVGDSWIEYLPKYYGWLA